MGRFMGFSQGAVELAEIQSLAERILARTPNLPPWFSTPKGGCWHTQTLKHGRR